MFNFSIIYHLGDWRSLCLSEPSSAIGVVVLENSILSIENIEIFKINKANLFLFC